jgi:NRAMP (natural resistance-associated macrophage protein)-like metal ion transporter
MTDWKSSVTTQSVTALQTPTQTGPMPQAPFAPVGHAVLDSAHVGDIRGALGTIAHHDVQPRLTFGHRLRTLLAILGPGLIVMVGDNDAGAFGTYTQAGQNYGTTLLWTLLLLVPVLYVNQEMVLRLGAVTGVGHARLIFERFGRFWGAFSVIDLFLLNALTIVTEFIGISLGLDYLGLSRFWGVSISALLIMVAASTGDFRRFERFALFLVFGSLLLVPVFLMIPPPMRELAHDFFIPQLPKGGNLNEVMLLIIAIVGTTVAPWQLFFQQSYVVDKRITPRFIRYERLDLWLGIVLVVVGAVAMMGFTAATFAGRPEFGQFADAGAVAAGMEKYFGRAPGVLFALALIDACIIGASAVSLATAYALGDVLSIRHSLHRKPTEAVGFYAFFFGLIVLAAALVLTPGTPLGLLTNLVQTLAGVLLPSATVFLLLLCNDRAVLGPWVNGRAVNVFTATIIAILVMLSVILTASVLFPDISESQIIGVLVGGSLVGIALTIGVRLYERTRAGTPAPADPPDPTPRAHWRMPPLHLLARARLTLMNRVWMGVLRAYLVIAAGLLLLKLIQMAAPGHAGA